MKGKDFDVSKHRDVIDKEDAKYRKAVIDEAEQGLSIVDYDKYKRAQRKFRLLMFAAYLMLFVYLGVGVWLGYDLATEKFMANCLEQVNLYDACTTVAELFK